VATVDDLAGVPLFEAMSPADLQQLAPRFAVETAAEGKRLCGEGAAGYSFFILTEGDAVVTSGDDPLGTLGPGDFFGEVAILGGGRRTATVTTTSAARLLVLHGTDFRRLQQEQPEIATRIEDAMRQRLAVGS
jgi:CRP-like cAMP-binding protein